MTHCIVGASSDIGAELISLLNAKGEKLHLIARDTSDLPTGDTITHAQADVRDLNELKVAITQAGSLRSLTYLPGTIVLKKLSMITEDDVKEHLQINTIGALFAAQYAQAQLTEGQGSVVFVSTVAAQKGFANHALISLCKSGLEGLTVALAKELSPAVRVNCVAPSLTQTKLSASLLSNQSISESLAKLHPLKRLGNPQDIANSIEFLLSGKSGWITGQILHVDGGRSYLD